MMRCDDARSALHLYLDGELAPTDELELEAHLVGCAACRGEHDALRQVVDTVRGATPLYESSPALRDKLAALVRTVAGTPRKQWGRRLAFCSAVAACIVLVAMLVPLFPRTSFTAYAADAHIRYASGKLPLDVASDRPQVVSAWLQARLPFHLSVPQYPSDSREPKAYTLAGARLMQYQGADVAYLAYTMNSRPVSLLVSSSGHIVPAGQDVYRSGNLLFHFSAHKGLKLITWRDRDLVYALVSDIQVSNAQSCIVCHGSAAERSRYENMAPERP
jgi:anti-sigma factor RsiW